MWIIVGTQRFFLWKLELMEVLQMMFFVVAFLDLTPTWGNMKKYESLSIKKMRYIWMVTEFYKGLKPWVWIVIIIMEIKLLCSTSTSIQQSPFQRWLLTLFHFTDGKTEGKTDVHSHTTWAEQCIFLGLGIFMNTDRDNGAHVQKQGNNFLNYLVKSNIFLMLISNLI